VLSPGGWASQPPDLSLSHAVRNLEKLGMD